MYTTPDSVMAATSYTDVTMAQVLQAQFVIEIYTGRIEGEITSSRDKEMLARATAAQVVYMRDNSDVTFEQISAQSITRGDGQTVFKAGDDLSPFIAPLAIMACKHLTWRQSRSISVGKTFGLQEKMRALYWMAMFTSVFGGEQFYGLDGTSASEYATMPFDREIWDEV